MVRGGLPLMLDTRVFLPSGSLGSELLKELPPAATQAIGSLVSILPRCRISTPSRLEPRHLNTCSPLAQLHLRRPESIAQLKPPRRSVTQTGTCTSALSTRMSARHEEQSRGPVNPLPTVGWLAAAWTYSRTLHAARINTERLPVPPCRCIWRPFAGRSVGSSGIKTHAESCELGLRASLNPRIPSAKPFPSSGSFFGPNRKSATARMTSKCRGWSKSSIIIP